MQYQILRPALYKYLQLTLTANILIHSPAVTLLPSSIYPTQINDLENDLRDGLVLISLIEHLTEKPVTKKYQKAPSHRLQQLDNMEVVLEVLNEEGIKLVSTSEYKPAH